MEFRIVLMGYGEMCFQYGIYSQPNEGMKGERGKSSFDLLRVL